MLSGATLSSVSPWLEWAYLAGWVAYLIALVFSWKEIMRFEPKTIAICATPYIFLSHLWYGGKFLEGLLSSKLKKSLGR